MPGLRRAEYLVAPEQDRDQQQHTGKCCHPDSRDDKRQATGENSSHQ
jgi:hypothetical protein